MDAYNTRRKDWEDLDVSKEELKNLTECLKKEEFRKLLIEYAEEVTDPENRKIYENEITQLEKERGVDVTFVNPEPGYVIKTSVNGEKKCFVNISKSETVAKPSSQPSYEEGHRGLQWSIPYTLVPPRDDLDKKNVRCTVFDVVFHPDTLYLASRNDQFRGMVNNTAMDGVETNFKVKLDRKNVTFPNIRFKGTSQPAVIRKSSEKPAAVPLDIEPEIYQKLMSSYDDSRERQKKSEEKPRRSPAPTTYYKTNKSERNAEESSDYATPKFVVKHQTNVELEDFQNHKNAKLHSAIPRKLVVVVDLPLLKSASDASLDVQERSLGLTSEKPAKYRLNLPLPYPVDPDNGNAKFDVKYKKLTITLPVVRGAVPLSDAREDSGVDSDHGSPSHGFSDETNSRLRDGGDLESSAESAKRKESPLITELSRDSAVNECEDTALRTSEIDDHSVVPFMNASIKYSLPAFNCNLYENTFAVTVNVKNVEADSIRHRTLMGNSGVHILLTSLGAGFFPAYYSLCLKISEDSVDPDSLTVEPWDNNVVFTIALKNTDDLACYHVGIDEEFMEKRDLPTSVSLKNRFNDLMVAPQPEPDKRIQVLADGDDIVINIRSNQLDSDDEIEREECAESLRKKGRNQTPQKARSISESSGDELPSGSSGSTNKSKGILKSRRMHGLSRSMSESSVDDNAMLASSADIQSYSYNSVNEMNSESDYASLKKTVRFSDVVSRQLYRSNSSILGRRKKNQRKLQNKKRAHERRVSESENSETEEREKYKVSPKETTLDTEKDALPDNVKPILSRERSSVHQKTASIEIERSRNNSTNPSHNMNKRKESDEAMAPPEADKENASDTVKAEFKNDLIFDLDM